MSNKEEKNPVLLDLFEVDILLIPSLIDLSNMTDVNWKLTFNSNPFLKKKQKFYFHIGFVVAGGDIYPIEAHKWLG